MDLFAFETDRVCRFGQGGGRMVADADECFHTTVVQPLLAEVVSYYGIVVLFYCTLLASVLYVSCLNPVLGRTTAARRERSALDAVSPSWNWRLACSDLLCCSSL